jgi:Nif-specific regulatory protein
MIVSELKTNLSFNGLSVIYNVSRTLTSGIDLEKILSEVLEILEIHAGFNRGMISILNSDGSELNIDIARGVPEKSKRTKYKLGEGITGKVVETGKSILVPDVRKEPAFLNKTGARSNLKDLNIAFFCVPIKSGNNVIGALSVDRTIDNNSRTINLEDELRFLEAIADLISEVVKERRLQQEKISALEKENLELRKTLEELGKPEELIGNSSLMKEVFRQIAQVAPSPTTVLIRGETGTGKELVARAIHQKSMFKNGPFIAVNCAALPESLLESELFGHEKGSFTGAIDRRLGKFELANNGTLFLDEIAEMSLSAQARLLRAIQEREFQRVGGTNNIKVNVRLICATNRDLEKDVENGRFREDLYYRINVFTIHLPPLRNRGADILLLADFFVKKYSKLHKKTINRISTPAIDMLSGYHWPGNVRELENVIERAVIVTTTDTINGHDLPPTLQLKNQNSQASTPNGFIDLVQAYEKELITEALKDCRGNQTKAAKSLGITKRIIQYKIKKYKIDYERFRH